MTDTAPTPESDPGSPSQEQADEAASVTPEVPPSDEAPATAAVSEEAVSPSSETPPAAEPVAQDPDHPVFGDTPGDPTVHTGDDDDPDREGRKLA